MKFNEKGEIVVAVKKLKEVEKDFILEFRIKDTGIGMSPAEASKLFKPFTQADSSTYYSWKLKNLKNISACWQEKHKRYLKKNPCIL